MGSPEYGEDSMPDIELFFIRDQGQHAPVQILQSKIFINVKRVIFHLCCLISSMKNNLQIGLLNHF